MQLLSVRQVLENRPSQWAIGHPYYAFPHRIFGAQILLYLAASQGQGTNVQPTCNDMQHWQLHNLQYLQDS